MKVAVIAAALNEAEAIGRLLNALAAQTRLPDLVVIADGGSTDGTVEKCAALATSMPFRLVVLPVPGKIARGRNAAIAQAQCDVVAVTDADCVPVPSWLHDLVQPIEGGGASAVAGSYYANAATSLERAIATFTWVPLKSDSKRFLPSHRSVAYLRRVWSELQGYDERIDSGEDTAFDLQVEARFHWVNAPSALVAWRPRTTIKKALWQQIFYGAGDGQARIQRRYHVAVGVFVAAELAAALSLNAHIRTVACLPIICALTYFCLKHHRLFRRLFPDQLYVIILGLLLPPARLLGFSVGYFGGSVRKILNRS